MNLLILLLTKKYIISCGTSHKTRFMKIINYKNISLKIPIPSTYILWWRTGSVWRIFVKVTVVEGPVYIWKDWRGNASIAQAIPVKPFKPPEKNNELFQGANQLILILTLIHAKCGVSLLTCVFLYLRSFPFELPIFQLDYLGTVS